MNRIRAGSRAGLVCCWVTLVLAMLLVGCGSGSEDAVNEPPNAEAGADQEVFESATVTLRGTGSDTDGTIRRYSWTQTSGLAITLSAVDQAVVSFTAPDVAANTALVFRLAVIDDEGATASDEVTVTVIPVPNQPPSAEAGADQRVGQGTTVTLQGSASDADGTIASYSWTQISGPVVLLATANQAVTSFVAPSVGADTALVLRLAVTDDEGATASDEVTVTVSLFTVFRDCGQCPEMVTIPAGSFLMGSPFAEEGRDDDEGPQHRVAIAQPFAVGKYEVTFAEWDGCHSAGGCSHNPDDRGWGRGNRPVIRVNWEDAQEYVRWLSKETGKEYRLLTEAEWEYAARAGTTDPFHTGVTISTDQANYNGLFTYGLGTAGVYREQTVEMGAFAGNAFGLHDVQGNVWEWVEDCWHGSYAGAPVDGSAWMEGGNCRLRLLRGGAWLNRPGLLRAANRIRFITSYRDVSVGLRVARTLTP